MIFSWVEIVLLCRKAVVIEKIFRLYTHLRVKPTLFGFITDLFGRKFITSKFSRPCLGVFTQPFHCEQNATQGQFLA